MLAIERIDVGASRVEALVRVAPGFLRTSVSPGLPARAFALLPGFARHSCDNDAGVDFRRELADTETAHLLEHTACELMALAGSPRSLRAETRWDFAADGRGVYRIALDFDDDFVAIGALNEAVAIVEWMLDDSGEMPEVGAIVEGLAAFRQA